MRMPMWGMQLGRSWSRLPSGQAARPVLIAPVTGRKPPGQVRFSTSPRVSAKNVIYTPVRRPDDLHTYTLLSASSRTPLLTLWTASWCATCRAVAPLVEEVVASGAGEAEGGVALCAVELDAPDVASAGLGTDYMITSLPTLLCIDAGEAQSASRLVDPRRLADRAFLEDWVRAEARRGGNRGGGGSWW